MIPTISQVCTLNSPFETDVEEYSQAGLRAVEIWFTKLEVFATKNSIAQIRKLLADNSLTPAVASLQGGLLTGPSERRDESWSLFVDRIQLCNDVGIGTMIVACDIHAPLETGDLRAAEKSLKQVATIAEQSGIRIALEFQSQAAFGNNLQTAAALVNQISSSHLGICFDAFHFFTGPSKLSDLGYLHRDNLFHVQLSDLVDVPRELATDSDRIMPGDGDFELSAVVNHLRKIDYRACVSLELMNPQIWQVSPRQVSEIGLKALARLFE